MHAGGSGFRHYDSPNIKLDIWLIGAGHLSLSWAIGVQLVVFFCSSVSVVLLMPQGCPSASTRCNRRVLVLAASQTFHLISIVASDDTLLF